MCRPAGRHDEETCVNDLIDVGIEKQLYIDNSWFFDQRGMTLAVNPPVKAERVIVPETPWERKRVGAGTVVEHVGRYLMFYTALNGDHWVEPHYSCICLAESEDGRDWKRSKVDLYEWEGHKKNNIVMCGVQSAGIMVDPNGPDEHRFKALIRARENAVWPESKGAVFERAPEGRAWSELYLASSPDGINWKRHEPSALPFFHDTLNHFFYDTRLGRYAAYVRTRARKRSIRTVGRVEINDPLDLPWPYVENPEAPRGPGRSRKEAGGEFPITLTCDESDPPDTDLYTPCVHQYPWAADAYFSFTTPYRHYPVGDTSDTAAYGKDERGRYKNDGLVEVQLAVSRDGIYWSRPDRRPYVPLGIKGSWDGGQTYMHVGMIRKGDEIWQFYNGSEQTHGADFDIAMPAGGTCRLVQRLDGFISADADYTGAEFTTPLLTFSGSSLELNADCGAMGEIWVEIRDERNVPIPGFRLEESISVERNQIRAPVVWKERESVAELAGRPVRLHFRLRACKLYAFRFAD